MTEMKNLLNSVAEDVHDQIFDYERNVTQSIADQSWDPDGSKTGLIVICAVSFVMFIIVLAFSFTDVLCKEDRQKQYERERADIEMAKTEPPKREKKKKSRKIAPVGDDGQIGTGASAQDGVAESAV